MDKHEALLAAERSKDVEGLRQAVAGADQTPVLAATLSRLLLEKWHESHEDIVFELGLIGDPRTTRAILKAAQFHLAYLEHWGNVHEFQRKCAYALARIGTAEAREALEVLAGSEDPQLREYASEGLAKWPLPFRRPEPKA
jgi:HEAT repeat protein